VPVRFHIVVIRPFITLMLLAIENRTPARMAPGGVTRGRKRAAQLEAQRTRQSRRRTADAITIRSVDRRSR
jgi:hypothetical protein